MENPLIEYFVKLPDEIRRIQKIAGTLQGADMLRKVWEAHFNEKWTHVNDAIYDIARVNIIR